MADTKNKTKTKTTNTATEAKAAKVIKVEKDESVNVEKELKDTKQSLEIANKEKEELAKVVANLSNQVKAIQEGMAQAPQQNVATIIKESTQSGDERDVAVTSLTYGGLNLTTEKYGEGVVYSFTEFGETKDIPLYDLKKIFSIQRKFFNGGLAFIQDEDIVKKFRLGNAYKNMLSEDALKTILRQPATKVVELYKIAPKAQQETIVSMIVDGRLKGENVDANVLLEIGNLAKKDLINLSPILK